MAVPMGEITRALVGVRRRLCVKWGFVDMDVYEQEYRFYYFARCPYEKTDTTFRSIPLTTESFPQKEGGEAVWVLIIFTVSNSQPLEVVVEHFIQTKFVRPKVRPYQTDNYYDALMRQYKLEKEVERIVFQKEATGKKHQNACKSESEAAARN